MVSLGTQSGGIPAAIPTLDVVLVNRNSGDLLGKCLRSIATASHEAFALKRVCVVDDCSTDESLRGLDQIPVPLQIIRNEQRLGYGASCNRGVQAGSADYILFLNTDIVLEPNSIDLPIAQCPDFQQRGYGIVSIKLIEKDGSVARTSARFPTVWTFFIEMFGLERRWPGRFRGLLNIHWDHMSTREVDQVIGAYMLLPRRVFDDIGGYSPHYFVYMEDLDFCLRARRAGWKSLYFSEAQAFHLGGGTARKVFAESLFFNLRSRIQFGYLNFGWFQGTMLALGTLVIEPITRLLYYLRHRKWQDAKAGMVATARVWRWAIPAAASYLIGQVKRPRRTHSHGSHR